MFVKNDLEGKWVNGTIGKVSNLNDDTIEVEITSEGQKYCYYVDRQKWEIPKYKYNYENRTIGTEIVGEYIQFPLILAWSVTIHKSQGLTFDDLIIDLERGAFAYGQVYVALSRAKSLEGIFLQKPISSFDIKVDIQISRFLGKIKFLGKNQIKELINTWELKNVTQEAGFNKNESTFSGENIPNQIEMLSHQDASDHSKLPVGESTHLLSNHKETLPKTLREPSFQNYLNNSAQKLKRICRYSEETRIFLVIGIALVALFLYQFLASTVFVKERINPTQQPSGVIVITPTIVRIKPSQIAITSTSTEKFNSTPTPKPENTSIQGCLYSVSSLSIRECPGTNYIVIGYLLNGECVEIIGKDETNTWIALEGGGWVNAYYLEINDDLKMLPILGCLLD